MRAFRVVDDSMRPTLVPGDGVIAMLGGAPRRGQLRLFRDPRMSTRWFVKRVGDVHIAASGTIFEARSDNPNGAGADSHAFGPISAAGTYRVIWTTRGKVGP